MVSEPSAKPAQGASIDADEIAKFERMAATWWDPTGPFRPLHLFNPVRLGVIRRNLCRHFARDAKSLQPLVGLTALDIGCGGGLVAEPLARLGAAVTGIDASEKNTRIAAAHARTSGLAIDYRPGTAEAEAQAGRTYDIVLNLEVVEHVADPAAFLAVSAGLLRPGGLMVVATLNKTLRSLALAKIGAEHVLRWLPPGTHDWRKFLSPAFVRDALVEAGLEVAPPVGFTFDPLRWAWRESGDVAVNYMLIGTRLKDSG